MTGSLAIFGVLSVLLLAGATCATGSNPNPLHDIDSVPEGAGEWVLSMARDTADLGHFIDSVMAVNHVPGMAALLVRDGQILWSGAYGWD